MSKKIFRSIVSVAIIVLVASLIIIFGILYSYFAGIQKNNLKSELQLAARGIELNGVDYFNQVEIKDYRVTLISKNGAVLYDSSVNADKTENHLEREEVKEALESGYGESIRYSDTLSEKQYYYAKLLSDGSVLRLSGEQNTIWTLMLGFAQPICIVILIAIVISFALAIRLSKKIVEPINEIELDSPDKYRKNDEYKEIKPLLDRLAHQQEQIKKDKTEIEKTALIRQEFTANVSHELKTPLHVIAGYSELIENGMVREEDIKPFASKIRAESIRMGALVEDIINLTNLDSGAKDSERENTDLYRIAQNAMDSLQPAADEKKISLALTGESAMIYGVPSVLYSIVYNLCDNAIKYNSENGKVNISVENLNDKIILNVSDTGIGISNENKDRIFERFYRVNKSHSKEVGGTGLGLSIVKHGAIIHGAKIEVDSEVGKGSTFRVIFNKE